MPDINGIPYVESTDLVSAYPAVSLALAQELDDQLAAKADYPSGGSNGDLLTKSGTTTAWAAPSVAGLTLITSESFSAVSSVSINGCFTSSYDNYAIVLRILGTADENLLMRLRVSGSDNSGSNYINVDVDGSTTTTTTQWRPTALGSTNHSAGTVHVFAPNDAVRTQMISHVAAGNGTLTGYLTSATHTQSTAYDGFTFYPSSGTITGTLRVYGYKD